MTRHKLALLQSAVGLLALAGCAPAAPGATTVPSGTKVELPVSDWSPPSGSAFGWSLQGTLVADGSCIRLQVEDGSTVTPVWPAGHTAYQDSDGIAVFDWQGREVARSGQQVDFVGGYSDVPYPNECTKSGSGTFVVQEDISRGY